MTELCISPRDNIEPLAHDSGVQRLNLPARAKGHGDELHGGKVPTLLASAAIMVVLGLLCARLLRQRALSDARV
ncbi:hypothetical protein [Bradyrhizobium sp. CB1015]|uniref:hypothetical protein n=1 Tax=Bradyrhizobium sp. CB1015 TaxID=2976822 RepID=UPI0021AAC5C9|nr:hypothetical protein [Bradyrhizobium sp. CB1015]UWU89568.1 hypothetical protein N2604_24050 [Bradyrhizobium sp. CB1015]